MGSMKMPGVIWITGFSAAGKTTIGRKVNALLKDMGSQTIFLDGDDLRSIFGSNWGYDREQRIDLARVYFRLSSHLVSQGFTVIISAVAMYEEIYDWVRTYIPRTIQVYLMVPEDERRRRDKLTKNVYESMHDLYSMYDEPTSCDLIIENYGGAGPDQEARRIVDLFLTKDITNLDMGRTKHWKEYYSKDSVPAEHSPFAESLSTLISGPVKLLEIGCGNGRDAFYFARLGHSVVAIDLSETAIETCKRKSNGLDVSFFSGRITELSIPDDSFDIVYMRFVLHAMPLEEEIATIKAVFRALAPGGEIHVECRSINDPMARNGEVISPTERVYGHYRRFIVLEELVDRLERMDFEIVNSVESNGCAVFRDEDPVVVRVSARKPL